MRIRRSDLKRIIREQIATVTNSTIIATVRDVLSVEGGAAGLEPIEVALRSLESDDISLPDMPIEDIITSVPGVVRHSDGDFVDTNNLTEAENKIKITEKRLRGIIREEIGRIAVLPRLRGQGDRHSWTSGMLEEEEPIEEEDDKKEENV